MSEEKKEMVFGAISKTYLEKKMKELVENNKDVLEEYFMLQQAIQTEVKMNQPESEEALQNNETE